MKKTALRLIFKSKINYCDAFLGQNNPIFSDYPALKHTPIKSDIIQTISLSFFHKVTFALFVILLPVISAFALTGSQINVSRSTAPFFFLDSNTPCAAGPRAAHIGIKLRGLIAGDTIFGLSIRLDSIVGSSLFKLVGPLDSTLTAGKLNPLDSNTTYFYVKYPCTHALSATYYFSITDDSVGKVSFNTTITTRSSISANAGGLVDSSKVGYYDALGTILTDTVVYSFGNIQVGDEIEFQPNGDTTFKADKVRLLNARVLTSMLATVPVGTQDKLYYVATAGTGGANNKVKVVYYYKNLLYNDTTILNPYAGTTSGSTNFKYSGNYGARAGGFRTTTNSIRTNITKTANGEIFTPCDTVTYTINVINTFSQILQVDQMIDKLPLNYKYMGLATGSEVTLANSSDLPSIGDSGTISFLGFVPDTIFPYESYKIYPGDTLTLKYKAKTRCIASETLDTNWVYLKVGDNNVDTAFDVTCAGCSVVPVDLIYFFGKEKGEDINLQWATAIETQSSHFNVHRKRPDGTFEFIGSRQAAGESMQLLTYVLTDHPPASETNLIYRLDQFDINGNKESFFTSVQRGKVNRVIVYPNPIGSGKLITVVSTGNWQEMIITDAVGKVISKVNNDRNNAELFNVSTLGWDAGLYYLQLIDANRNVTHLNIQVH